MESEDLIQIMKKVEDKGMEWGAIEEKIKVSHELLNMYARSGPVPVTIINNLKKLLEDDAS